MGITKGGYNMEEQWKDIQGYEGYYQVSNLGRVKSLYRVSMQGHKMPEKILKQDESVKGYRQVSFCVQGKRERIRVHQLVARNFIENVNDYPQINHKDENPRNNRVENLEWCTQLYNNLYNDRHKRIGLKLEKPIYVIKDDIDMYFPSSRIACRELDLHEGHVSGCLTNRLKAHKGYTYEFA